MVIFIGIAIAFGGSLVLLYTRKQSWNTDRLRWTLTGMFAFAGTVGLIAMVPGVNHDGGSLFACMLVPLFYNCCDRLFKKISERKQGRDFYLYLRGSNEIDDRMGGKNPHVTTLDIVFSSGLWLLIVAGSVCAVMLFKSVPL